MNKFVVVSLVSAMLGLSACSKQASNNTGIDAQEAQSQGIVGGTVVNGRSNYAKTTVQIYIFEGTRGADGKMHPTSVAGCTGSILANDIVLTAAHCTTGNPQNIVLYFAKDIPSDMRGFVMGDMGTNPNVRQVVAGKTTDEWPKLNDSKEFNWGDVAVLKFDGGLPDGYKPATLLPQQAQLQDNQQSILAGYGLTNGQNDTKADTLMQVKIKIAKADYSETEMLMENGACHGDSGGPAYVKFGNKVYVAGVTSRADMATDPQGVCIGRSVYTKTQAWAQWIGQTINEMHAADFKPAPIAQPMSNKGKISNSRNSWRL